MRGRTGLVVNPTSGKHTGARIGALARELLVRQGDSIIDLSADSGPLATSRARAAVSSGEIDRLVVVGGDGMVHLGVNACAGTEVPLGIVAAGTGNDIARELGLPVQDASAAVARIVDPTPRRIDAARLVEHPEGVAPSDRWFAGVLGAGFDAVVNERANRWAWPKGRARYNLAILRELPVFRPLPYVIEVDDARIETQAMLVAVGNGPSYGGGMRVTPDAAFDDGLLDILILREVSTVEFLRVFPRVFTGRHVDHPAVDILRGRRVSLATPGIVGYADGERWAPLPLTCEVVPAALTILG